MATESTPGQSSSTAQIGRGERHVGARPTDLERELGHDEYDPIGTLVLIALYFAILVVLWLFTYFVEFLGNDLTVVGTVLG